jgi:hypothetical protein
LETELIRVLRKAGRIVYIHIPISGGEMLNDTLLGLKTLAESASAQSLVVWLNEYFGPVARDGKDFNEMQVYSTIATKSSRSLAFPSGVPIPTAKPFGACGKGR